MEVLGNGIYSASECAHLLGVHPRKVLAWFRGWPHGADALLSSDYEKLFDKPSLSFLDFVDTAVVITLKERHGASTPLIRRLRKALKKEWNTKHPFAREEFYTDETGRRVFCTLASEDEGPPHLLEILEKQFAIAQVLLPFLKKVEYCSETRLAQVFNLTDRVILDPRRKYGKPIVRGTGMPTAILYQCFRETRSAEIVADWYDVAPEDVDAAVRYEKTFKGIAA